MVKTYAAIRTRTNRIVWAKANDEGLADHGAHRYDCKNAALEERKWLGNRMVSFHIEGNPEAITDRPPIGLTSKHLKLLTGPKLSKAMVDALIPPNNDDKVKKGFQPWMAGAMLAAFALLLIFWPRIFG